MKETFVRTASDQQLLSVYDAGKILALSPWTIRQWCYSGKIASHKLGTRLMISHSEVARVLHETLRPRTTQAENL